MRPRVESTWRTRLLLLFAFVAAGVIAWNNVETRIAAEQPDRARATDAATETPASRVDLVDVEIVTD